MDFGGICSKLWNDAGGSIYHWYALIYVIFVELCIFENLFGTLYLGFCAGAYTLVVPVYISEITTDRLRGTMSNCMVVSLVTGILFS